MIIVDGENYLDEIKELIIEYTKMLNRDLSFQNLDFELNNLGKKYLPPNGRIFVLLDEENNVGGCVAYCHHHGSCCEMKRLYVKPNFRKHHYGQKLVEMIIKTARKDGYKIMLLDTIKPLQEAISLYRKVGFIEIEPYYNNPMNDAIYMKLVLE